MKKISFLALVAIIALTVVMLPGEQPSEAQEPPDCDDGNACTIDYYDPCEGCLHFPVDCDDGDPCTIDTCDPETGCQHELINCDDSNPCTIDSCVDGTCQHVPKDCGLCATCNPSTGNCDPKDCDDGQFCTDDSCNPGTGQCTHSPKSCDDGNLCTTDSCDEVNDQCVHTPKDCSDGQFCTNDSCDPGTGECVHSPKSCDDGNLCTTDSCDEVNDQCVHTAINCDDGDACTSDSCDPATGCQHTEITCDDGSLCTTDSCDPETGCQFDPITCNDGDPCTIDSCDPAYGCQYTPIVCNDGDPCTIDACVGGECQYTQITCPECQECVGGNCVPINCDDGNPCTEDSCNPNTGQCVHTLIDCDDGDICTLDWCEDGTCYHRNVCGPGVSITYPCYLRVNMLGEIYVVDMDCCGNWSLEYCKALDPDELHYIEVEYLMKIICGECEGCECFPRVIVMSMAEESPNPPDGTVVVGGVYYDFTGYRDTLMQLECPVGTFFDPPIPILIGFDPETIPPDGYGPYLAWFDAEQGIWIPVPSNPNQLAGSDYVTGLADHFASTFAVLVNVPPEETPPPPPPPPTPTPAHFVVSNLSVTPSESKVDEIVTVSVNVTNDGEQEGTYLVELMINGQKVKDGEVEVTLGAGQSEEVTFAVSKAEAGQYEVVVSGLSDEFTVVGEINWWLWGSIIAVVVLFIAWLIWYRQRRMGAEPAP